MSIQNPERNLYAKLVITDGDDSAFLVEIQGAITHLDFRAIPGGFVSFLWRDYSKNGLANPRRLAEDGYDDPEDRG